MCYATPDVYESNDMNSCNLLVMEDVKQMCTNKETDQLEALLQSPNWQAFFDIDYGGVPGGVFTAACPPEALHSLENGIVLHCLKQLYDVKTLGVPAKASLDAIIQKWVNILKQYHIQSYDGDFSSILLQDGNTTISDIPAGTKMGILFAFVVAAQTNEGYTLLHQYEATAKRYGDMLSAFEMLLCYWAWLKKKSIGTQKILRL